MPRPLEGIINYDYPPGHALRYPRFGIVDADLFENNEHIDVDEVARALVSVVQEVERMWEFVETAVSSMVVSHD